MKGPRKLKLKLSHSETEQLQDTSHTLQCHLIHIFFATQKFTYKDLIKIMEEGIPINF